MAKDKTMEGRLANLLKDELRQRSISYAELADRLNTIGVETTESSVKNKLYRRTFSAAFFAQCLAAIGSDRLRLD